MGSTGDMMKEINKTNVADASESEVNWKPSIATIKILKGVSENFDINFSDIKERYRILIASKIVRDDNDQPEIEKERQATRLLIRDLEDRQNLIRKMGIDLYCDFDVELAKIRDKITRTSVKMVDIFGAEYDFSSTLKEIDRVRSLLEDRQMRDFWGSE